MSHNKPATPVMGGCRLCLSRNVPLLDSHILPKWAYRRARDPTRENGAPDPIQFRDGAVLQTSSQIREYMLCGACEQRLGKDEDYVSHLAYQSDGTLGLQGLLLDCQAIARFAVSVFWRAHAAQKPKLEGLRLWNPQAEALRRFVLGERALPDRMCLMFIVLVDGEEMRSMHSTTTTTPTTAKKGDNGFHQLLVAGLLFNLTTGSHSIPLICPACGPSPHVIFQDWRKVLFATSLTEGMLSGERKGRLA